MAPSPRPEIARLPDRAPDESAAPGERALKLNTDEAPFPPSPAVLAAIRDLEPESLRAYPPADAPRFCEAAAHLHGLKPENVLPGNGSEEILAVIIRTFVPPGGRVATPWPGFELYETLCLLQPAEILKVDWLEGWTLPADRLLAQGAQAIFLASPNVPSGTAVPAAQLAELAGKFRGLLVIDEAYADFADDSAIPLLADHDNIVLTRSLSKGYALAGVRFGYALAHPQVIAALRKARQQHNTSALAQAAALAAIGDQDYARRMWQHVRDERGRLTLELQLLGFDVAPSQANFIFASHPSFPGEELWEGLRKQGVLVRRRPEKELAGALQITVGNSQENNALLGALEMLIGKGRTPDEKALAG